MDWHKTIDGTAKPESVNLGLKKQIENKMLSSMAMKLALPEIVTREPWCRSDAQLTVSLTVPAQLSMGILDVNDIWWKRMSSLHCNVETENTEKSWQMTLDIPCQNQKTQTMMTNPNQKKQRWTQSECCSAFADTGMCVQIEKILETLQPHYSNRSSVVCHSCASCGTSIAGHPQKHIYKNLWQSIHHEHWEPFLILSIDPNTRFCLGHLRVVCENQHTRLRFTTEWLHTLTSLPSSSQHLANPWTLPSHKLPPPLSSSTQTCHHHDQTHTTLLTVPKRTWCLKCFVNLYVLIFALSAWMRTSCFASFFRHRFQRTHHELEDPRPACLNESALREPIHFSWILEIRLIALWWRRMSGCRCYVNWQRKRASAWFLWKTCSATLKIRRWTSLLVQTECQGTSCGGQPIESVVSVHAQNIPANSSGDPEQQNDEERFTCGKKCHFANVGSRAANMWRTIKKKILDKTQDRVVNPCAPSRTQSMWMFGVRNTNQRVTVHDIVGGIPCTHLHNTTTRCVNDVLQRLCAANEQHPSLLLNFGNKNWQC